MVSLLLIQPLPIRFNLNSLCEVILTIVCGAPLTETMFNLSFFLLNGGESYL